MTIRGVLQQAAAGAALLTYAGSSLADGLSDIALRWSMPIGAGASQLRDSRLLLVAGADEEFIAGRQFQVTVDFNALWSAYDQYSQQVAGKPEGQSNLGRNVLIGVGVVVVAVGAVHYFGTRNINDDYN